MRRRSRGGGGEKISRPAARFGGGDGEACVRREEFWGQMASGCPPDPRRGIYGVGSSNWARIFRAHDPCHGAREKGKLPHDLCGWRSGSGDNCGTLEYLTDMT